MYHRVGVLTVRDGKLPHIRKYINTQAPVRASQMEAFGYAQGWPFAAALSSCQIDFGGYL